MSGARPALSRDAVAATAGVRTREALSCCLQRICREIGASHYLLLATVHDRGAERAKVIASNWIYDTIELLGPDRIAEMASGRASALGEPPRPLFGGDAPAHGHDEAEALLRAHGHAEIYCLALQAGRRNACLMLSSRRAGDIGATLTAQAHLACSYLVSQLPETIIGHMPAGALSERERECLRWVSEGKTTDEVAVILGVTSNTVNSYIANAMQKVGASNRAMAIATAIRTGAI